MPGPNLLVGIASAVGVIFIWSGMIVFSRAGVITALTPYDLSALRFMVTGLLVLPFLRSWWPNHLPLHAMAIMVLCGPGAIYSLLLYLGLSEASAAYAGVFVNGSLPLFTMVVAYLVARDVPGHFQALAIAVIVLGGILLGIPGMAGGGADTVLGIVFFLSASAVLSVYIFSLRYWHVTPRQALALINLPNALIYLPLWYFLLPTGLAEAELSTIVFQALFQGLGPGFFALILFALAAIHLGPTATAGFSASVPATAALLAIPVLAEYPSLIEWCGIAAVTAGMALLVLNRK